MNGPEVMPWGRMLRHLTIIDDAGDDVTRFVVSLGMDAAGVRLQADDIGVLIFDADDFEVLRQPFVAASVEALPVADLRFPESGALAQSFASAFTAARATLPAENAK